MKQLNPSLQFADENGGVLKGSPVDPLGCRDQHRPGEQDQANEDQVMSASVDPPPSARKLEVAPSQLKPGEFQNNDGSGSQMGRWTREEHMKFVKCK